MSSPDTRPYGIWQAGGPCSACSPDVPAGPRPTELNNQQRTPGMAQAPHTTRTRMGRDRRGRAGKRRRNVVLGGGGIIVVIAVVLLMIGMRSESAEQQWVEGESYGDWTVRYTGYGQVTSDGQ